MKTKQIDLEIERLTMLKNRSELTENGIELLNELISLKEQLRIGDVVGRSEQFYCFNKQNKRLNRCMKQCSTCKEMKLMQ